MQEVVTLTSENAELKLKQEALLAQGRACAAIAVDFFMTASTAVKVKKEQNPQMNRQVQELNERVEEANQCCVCMEWACNRILTACDHTYCQVYFDSIASSAEGQRACPNCRKTFTKQQILPLFV